MEEVGPSEPLIALLGPDVRLAISPGREWNGQQEVGDALRGGMNSLGQWRLVQIMANRQAQPGTSAIPARPLTHRPGLRFTISMPPGGPFLPGCRALVASMAR